MRWNWAIDKVMLAICGFFLAKTVMSVDELSNAVKDMNTRTTVIEYRLGQIENQLKQK